MARRTLAPAIAALAVLCASADDALAAAPWVERRLTLPAGDWAFDFGLGLAHVPDDSGGGLNAEVAVGLTNRIELGLRTAIRFGDDFERSIGGDYYARPFDRQTFDQGADVLANPELRLRGALVREEVFELALEGRLVVPVAQGTDAGLMFGVPMAVHLGPGARLDVGVYVPMVFYPDDGTVGLQVPIDLWIQVARALWLGPMTGIAFDRVGRQGGTTDFSLGLGLGYSITRYLDFKATFLFPTINNESADFGLGAALQVRIE